MISPKIMEALVKMSALLRARGVRHAVIGGVATSFRSRPRTTQDLDFVLQIPQVTLPGLLEAAAAEGFTFERDLVIRQWTQGGMTLIRYADVVVDWLRPNLPCYQHVIDTAGQIEWQGATLQVASAEGIILTKLIAFRLQDQLDIRSLVSVTRPIDIAWLRGEWNTIADESDPRWVQFESWLRELGQPPVPGGTDVRHP